MKYVFVVTVFILSFQALFAQGDISNEKNSFIRNERTFWLMLNNNGWGGGFAYGQMLSATRKQLWNIELVTIKDPKELKINHPNYPDKNRFVFGKLNEFFNFRFGYGQLLTLFDKKDKGGIEVRWFYHGGLLGGVLKPVYYIVQESPLEETKFNASIHDPYDIIGGSSFFKGFNELSFVPGVYTKIGASFEFSRRSTLINAIEGGLTLDVFPKTIEIMANDQNNFMFLSFFVSYRFGKVINPRAKLTETEKEKNPKQ